MSPPLSTVSATSRLGQMLDAACASYGSAQALVGADATLTYADLSAAAEETRRQLGDVVGRPVLVPVSNLAADVAVLLGVWRAGGVVVPVHRSSPPAVVGQLLERTAARAVAGEAPAEWPTAPRDAPGAPPAPVDADSAYVLFTSGSTGRPKGVVLSHSAFAGKLARIESVLPSTPGGTTVMVLQLSFVYAQWVTLLTLLAGGRVVLQSRFTAEQALAVLRSEPVARFAVVPTMLRMLLPVLDAGAVGPDLIVSGGEPLPPALGRAVRQALPAAGLADVFGMTETSSTDFVIAPADYDRDAGLLGTPTPGVEVAVLDEHGAPVGAGGIGELRLRTPYLMSGYLDDPAATAAAVVDGWLRTGDLARVRPDGRLELAGRVGSLINRGGTKVSPLEVERVYGEHPAVAAALCTGLTDPVLGERIHLLIVPRPGDPPDQAALRAWGRERMEPFKVPDAVHMVEELPLGSTGKADRRAAATWLSAQASDQRS